MTSVQLCSVQGFQLPTCRAAIRASPTLSYARRAPQGNGSWVGRSTFRAQNFTISWYFRWNYGGLWLERIHLQRLEREGEAEYFAVQHTEKASPEKNNQQNI